MSWVYYTILYFKDVLKPWCFFLKVRSWDGRERSLPQHLPFKGELLPGSLTKNPEKMGLKPKGDSSSNWIIFWGAMLVKLRWKKYCWEEFFGKPVDMKNAPMFQKVSLYMTIGAGVLPSIVLHQPIKKVIVWRIYIYTHDHIY